MSLCFDRGTGKDKKAFTATGTLLPPSNTFHSTTVLLQAVFIAFSFIFASVRSSFLHSSVFHSLLPLTQSISAQSEFLPRGSCGLALQRVTGKKMEKNNCMACDISIIIWHKMIFSPFPHALLPVSATNERVVHRQCVLNN